MHEVTSQVVRGMHREEVDAELKTLGFLHWYVPQTHLKLIHEDTFQGTPLSGRVDVHIPFDAKRKSEATIHFALDAEERVVDVRVDGFGLGH